MHFKFFNEPILTWTLDPYQGSQYGGYMGPMNMNQMMGMNQMGGGYQKPHYGGGYRQNNNYNSQYNNYNNN